jgi:hypothetical protein
MIAADSDPYDSLLDLLADLLIEDFASDEKRQVELRSTTNSVAINDLTEMA